ncbi:hypothetical protein M422DRAFT_257377 [Sphaerobolus stellatus SS14]|uniref:Uncharacterized protein n=1 Tax=Sphaerobolus stellatus (strain SS14) TaxID=990650 RepID=A0A0C9VPK8_SPHS4|nr:hypothetical protein M422DRAFT_257377 [Sphaerobolus stellatus SS14]
MEAVVGCAGAVRIIDMPRAYLSVTDITPFRPSFPGGCPFFTSGGGTIGINPEFDVGGPVPSPSNYTGSGGLSNVGRPDSSYSRPENNK